VRPEGIEPPAYRFEACRSIHLSYGRNRSVGISVADPRERKPAVGVRNAGPEALRFAAIRDDLVALMFEGRDPLVDGRRRLGTARPAAAMVNARHREEIAQLLIG
jgi:hypothetical protein